MRIKFAAIACGGVSLLALATPAWAQDAAPKEEYSAINEIIVQARRREESAQDVPLVVQAVTGAAMSKLEIRQFEDVTRAVPGLQLVANSNGLGTTASIRGVNFDANASGASTTVEFYRNDAVTTSGALFQALYDIRQIEVLRGPQGTLRGRASPSGSITVTTRRPDLAEVGGYVSGTVTDKSRWNFNGAMNIPLVADKLAFRLAGFTGRNRGNDITGINVRTGATDDNIYDRSEALRASLRADPFDGILVLDFNYETIRHKNRQYDQVESLSEVNETAAASPVLVRAKDYAGVLPVPRLTNQTYQIYNWQAQLNLWGQSLTYVGSRVNGQVASSSPQDFSGLYATAMPVVPSPTGFVQINDNTMRQTTHEVRLQNAERVAGLFDYVVGYMRVAANSPTFYNSTSAIGSATTLYYVNNTGVERYRSDTEQSVFGNATLHLGDSIEFSGGLRQIWFKADSGVKSGKYGADLSTYVDSPSNRRCYGFSEIPGCLPVKKATIYSLVGKYSISRDAMVYASYGTSWRPGNSVIGWRGTEVGPFLRQFLEMPDERSHSYEIGLKSAWLDNRLTFNISAYSQKFTNYAYRASSPIVALSNTQGTSLASAFNFVAPVDAKVKGIEAEADFQFSRHFNMSASVAFADGKIRNGLFPCVDLNDDNVPDAVTPTASQLYAHVGADQVDTCRANTSPSSAPRWSGTVQAEYSHPLDDRMEGYVRGFVNWKGFNDGFSLNPYDQVSAFGLLDLFTGIRDARGAWELTLFVKNVLNTRRVLTRTDSSLVTSMLAGQNLANFGGSGTSISSTNANNYLGITSTNPREVGVTLRYAFGSR